MHRKHKDQRWIINTHATQFQFYKLVIIRNPKCKTSPPSQYNITKIWGQTCPSTSSNMRITLFPNNHTNQKTNLNNIMEISFSHEFVVDHMYCLLTSYVGLYRPVPAHKIRYMIHLTIKPCTYVVFLIANRIYPICDSSFYNPHRYALRPPTNSV